MPISFDLEYYRQLYNCANYFETGLWDPRCEVSSKFALRSNFTKIYCIELKDEWVNLGMDVFKNEILEGRYNLYKDDSQNMSKYLNDETFSERTMFFLDAHVDNSNIHNYKFKCPLFEELKAINTLSRKDHIILIDDLRILNETHPWGETSYGTINFLDKIKEYVLEINPDYKFTTLEGVQSDDVLLCYI